MNTLSIGNPIHEMDALFHNRLASVLGGEGQASVAWSPVVDIEETEQDYVIRAELPGLHKDKVKVTVEDMAFTGVASNYRVAGPGGVLLKLTQPNMRRGEPALEWEETGYAAFDPADVVLLRD